MRGELQYSLGIHLDENLSFNANTTALIGKLSRSIFFLNRVKHTLSQKALKSLYTVNLGLVSMNYIFHERNFIYLHGEDKVRS